MDFNAIFKRKTYSFKIVHFFKAKNISRKYNIGGIT